MIITNGELINERTKTIKCELMFWSKLRKQDEPFQANFSFFVNNTIGITKSLVMEALKKIADTQFDETLITNKDSQVWLYIGKNRFDYDFDYSDLTGTIKVSLQDITAEG